MGEVRGFMKYERKTSGSYYTPDDLVSLIIRETLEPLLARLTPTTAPLRPT